MYAFLDTEFIPAVEAASARLLSIGLCTALGQEFYREVLVPPADLRDAEQNDFIRTEVLPQMGRMPNGAAEPENIARDLAAWLEGLGATELEVCYDFHIDYDLFEALLALHASPPAVRLISTHVGYLNGDEGLEAAATACVATLELERGLRRHHALADALTLRAKFWAAHGE